MKYLTRIVFIWRTLAECLHYKSTYGKVWTCTRGFLNSQKELFLAVFLTFIWGFCCLKVAMETVAFSLDGTYWAAQNNRVEALLSLKIRFLQPLVSHRWLIPVLWILSEMSFHCKYHRIRSLLGRRPRPLTLCLLHLCWFCQYFNQPTNQPTSSSACLDPITRVDKWSGPH